MSDHIRDNRDNLLRVADALERIERHLAALILVKSGYQVLGDGRYDPRLHVIGAQPEPEPKLPICPVCHEPVQRDERFRQVEIAGDMYHRACYAAQLDKAEAYRIAKHERVIADVQRAEAEMEEAEAYRRAHQE